MSKTVIVIFRIIISAVILPQLFSHPPKRRRVTYASTIRPASASTLSTSSMKPLHGIISYCTCILV